MNTSTNKSSTSNPFSSSSSETAMPIYYNGDQINKEKNLFPNSIVWTPIPILTWFFPFLGHMGICMTSGVIRDFAGPYFVSENNMAFGNPTKYWQLDLSKVGSSSGKEAWDNGVYEASEVYKGRMHNLICDNCHSHVAMALNLMKYNNKTNHNMVSVWIIFMIKSRYVNIKGFFKSWMPTVIIYSIILFLILFFSIHQF